MLRTAGIPESDKQNDLEDKVLRTLKNLVTILPVIFWKLSIVLEDIMKFSSNARNGRITNRYFR